MSRLVNIEFFESDGSFRLLSIHDSNNMFSWFNVDESLRSSGGNLVGIGGLWSTSFNFNFIDHNFELNWHSSCSVSIVLIPDKKNFVSLASNVKVKLSKSFPVSWHEFKFFILWYNMVFSGQWKFHHWKRECLPRICNRVHQNVVFGNWLYINIMVSLFKLCDSPIE